MKFAGRYKMLLVTFDGIQEIVREHKYEIKVFKEVVCGSHSDDNSLFGWLILHKDTAHLLYFFYRLAEHYLCEPSQFSENSGGYRRIIVDEYTHSMDLSDNTVIFKLSSVTYECLRRNITIALDIINSKYGYFTDEYFQWGNSS